MVGVRALPVGGVDDADWEVCPPTREDQGDTTSGESVENSLHFHSRYIVWEVFFSFFPSGVFCVLLSHSLVTKFQSDRAATITKQASKASSRVASGPIVIMTGLGG